MQPGWYPDPYSSAADRWWDGSAWTAHAQPKPPGFDAEADLAGEERAARRASLGLIAVAAVTILGYVSTAVFFGHEIRHLVHEFRVSVRDANGKPPSTSRDFSVAGPQFIIDAFEIVSLVAEVLLMIWLHRAATLARRAGLAARRATVWAWLGFIVPIVSFWFPYQVAADALPPGNPARRLVAQWWTLWITQMLAGALIAVVSYPSRGAAVVLAIVLSAVPVAAALKGRAMIAATLASHRAITRSASTGH